MEKHTDTLFDLIIIGAGPAGLTAALYAGRRSLTTLVITKDIGGQASQTHLIENYPGFPEVDGPTLMNVFHAQAGKAGAQFVYKAATKIEQKADGTYEVTGDEKHVYKAHAIILAFGLEHHHLNVPGEKEYYGKGVTYCATCDGPLYKGREICVVGGGNSALDAIDYMSKLATRVHSFVRGDKFKGEEVMIDAVKQLPNVEFHFNTTIEEIKGDQFIKSVVVADKISGNRTEMPMGGVFVEVGYQPNTGLYKDLVDITDQGTIIVDKDCNTSRPGFFAAGDATTLSYKRIITSGGEGCKAALTAYSYIAKRKGVAASTRTDWSKK